MKPQESGGKRHPTGRSWHCQTPPTPGCLLCFQPVDPGGIFMQIINLQRRWNLLLQAWEVPDLANSVPGLKSIRSRKTTPPALHKETGAGEGPASRHRARGLCVLCICPGGTGLTQEGQDPAPARRPADSSVHAVRSSLQPHLAAPHHYFQVLFPLKGGHQTPAKSSFSIETTRFPHQGTPSLRAHTSTLRHCPHQRV